MSTRWPVSRCALAAALAAVLVTGCIPGLGPRIDPGIRPLAKVEGWRAGVAEGRMPDYRAVIEVAYDRETAQDAWRQNRPEATERSGLPREFGSYGAIADVDFATEAVVVFSAGESGSCPSWLSDIEVDRSGTVEVGTGTYGETCTDDNNPYRMIAAVERDLLPDRAQLPTTDVVVDGAGPTEHWVSLMTTYPKTS